MLKARLTTETSDNCVIYLFSVCMVFVGVTQNTREGLKRQLEGIDSFLPWCGSEIVVRQHLLLPAELFPYPAFPLCMTALTKASLSGETLIDIF